MVSVLEGIRLKNGIVPCGHNFDPSGSPLTWHLWHTRVHVPCKFGVSATSPSEILSSSCCYFRKNWKFKILTPLIFGPPLNFTILKDLVTLHPCTKFGVPRPNGVCARRHKAEKRDCALRAQFWPHGVITCLAHPPYQGASTLQVWNLCDRPFQNFVQLMLFFRKKNGNFQILTPLIFGPP